MRGQTESREDARALEMHHRLVDLGRSWRVVISTEPGSGEWCLILRRAACVVEYTGPYLPRVIAAAWAGARPGRVT